jgi:methionyl-tRNA formyltransferase
MSSTHPPSSWRIIVFTDAPQIAAMYARFLAARGHVIVGVVTSRKRNFGYIDVVASAPVTADVIVSDRPRRWARMLAPLRPDLIIATVFPWRIPQDVLDLPPLGAINLHPSLLPKYRGTMTPNWTFLNDERSAGITAHRMVADFDAGPILAQAEVEIRDDDDLMGYMQRLFGQTPTVLDAALARVAAGDPGDPQDESQATYFGALPEEQRVIDWSSPARRVHNQVRGFSALVAEPGAFATIDGLPSRVLSTRLLADDGSAGGAAPGTVLERGDGWITVQCGDRPIQVLRYEAETPSQPLP